MKIESVKNVNITVLFATPINHLLISQQGILDLFKTGVEEKDKRTSVEAPGLKVIIFPNRKKEFVFEGTRILVNDKSETLPKDSDVVDDFRKIFNSGMIEQTRLVAYGFNYDAVITSEGGNFKIDDLVSSKVASIPNITSAGINILFEKESIIYILDIKPIVGEQKFAAHFNAHFSTNYLPADKELKEKINKEFLEFKNVIEKI